MQTRDSDSYEQRRCRHCGKWMLALSECCPKCKSRQSPPPPSEPVVRHQPASVARFETVRCSYCNGYVLLGAIECPACHQYTDGRGKAALNAEVSARRRERIRRRALKFSSQEKRETEIYVLLVLSLPFLLILLLALLKWLSL